MSEIGRIILVFLGIGLVIFVHEAGHFFAARLCRVRVEVFSLGFGPRLFGWRRGSTHYQLALLPLGGYVKMAGEEREEGRRPASDELQAKSVGQRFFIYSGGVLMNIVFALVVFPILLAAGVPMAEPVVGETLPGSPAWFAGIQPGSRVLEVNGNTVLSFEHIQTEVALGPSDSTQMKLVDPGASEPRTLRMQPVYSTGLGIYTIGVYPSADAHGSLEIAPGSAAAAAGLAEGDRLLEVVGSQPGQTLRQQLEFAMREGAAVELVVERPGERTRERRHVTLEPRLEPQRGQRILGVWASANRVAAVRATPRTAPLALEKDDRLASVGGRPILKAYDLLLALQAAEGEVVFEIERGGMQRRVAIAKPAGAELLALAEDIALVSDSESNRIAVHPRGAAAEAGLRDGDRILAIGETSVARFEDLQALVREADRDEPLLLSVQRGSERLSLRVQPRDSAPIYGLNLSSAYYVYQATTPWQAVRVGVASSWKFLSESWLTLRRILTGQVSGENVGGIITIGVVSHSWAAMGLSKFFFFLCILSMNLALLNVLPIPVLDGGHLFFLLIEKLKGSPVSERVLGYSQIVGIVLIVSLMVYVTFNDIQRWILG